LDFRLFSCFCLLSFASCKLAFIDTLKLRFAKLKREDITAGKKRRILNLTDGSEKPVGEWNKMTIEALDNSIKVWVNDELVNHGFDGTARKGQIVLQAEGSEVEFRKVELRPINEFSN
jgi:hypothetical protein